MTEYKNHIDDYNFQELINLIESSPKNIDPLQIFLHQERDSDSRPDNEFLMVTPRVFGKVNVLNLTVEGDYVIVEFLDCAMQEVGNVRISIIDESPTVLFICWQDIKKIVLDENTTSYSDEGLLEFDF